MAATDISAAFIAQFESEVHLAYQRMGSKLKNTIRSKGPVKGSTDTFQKVGKGEATTKARHAELADMDLEHTNVTVTLGDWYAPVYIDKLDELKTNIDERGVAAQSCAGALGRKTDSLINTAALTATQSIANGGTGMTKAKVHSVFNAFGNADVPDDGERYWPVGPTQWSNLLDISEFANADYIGSDELPYKGGMTAKRWHGFMFFTFSGLSVAAGIRTTLAYHRTALGAAYGSDVQTEMNYIPQKVSTLVTSFMSMGAVKIDNDGVYKVDCSEA